VAADVDDRHPQEQGLKHFLSHKFRVIEDGSTTVIHKNKD